MQKQTLLLITSLALLSACAREAQETSSRQHPSAPDQGNFAVGEKVYKGTCSICHKTGLNGAPRLGNGEDWQQRIAQGNEVLYRRAIDGYRGGKGVMPARGGNPGLSDAEVRAAVDYVVVNSIPATGLH